jgi:hypothetical protein
VTDHEAVAPDQGIVYFVRTDFDFQHLTAIGHRETKRGVVLGRSARPKELDDFSVDHLKIVWPVLAKPYASSP